MKRLAILYFKKTGYSQHFAEKMPSKMYSDFKSPKTTLKQKIWAWRNGFFSDKIQRYGLTESNKDNFVADFDYLKMHPINGVFSRWIDDKLTTKMVLDNENSYFMPEYYFVINNNVFTSICEGKYLNLEGPNGLISLLKSKNKLALKKLAGSSGKDFYKLEFANDVYYINDKQADEKSVRDLLASLSVSVITEYIHAHDDLCRFYKYAPNALRLMVIKNENEFNIAASFIRIGSSKTGVVDNATAGGVFAGICVESGKISDAKTYNNDKDMVVVDYHPDTKIKIEGTVPNWEEVKKIVLQASEKMGVLCYLGFDVVVTPNGPKIIEINSHPTLTEVQKYYPLGENIYMQKLIKEKKANKK